MAENDKDPKGKEPGQPPGGGTTPPANPQPASKSGDAGGKPPVDPKNEPKPDEGKGPFRAKEQELADTKAELAKLRGELSGVKSGSEGLRKVLASAEAKAKDAEEATKAAIIAADRKVASAQAAAAGGQQPPRPPTTTATGTDQPPKDPGTRPEPRRSDPLPSTVFGPVRREPEPTRPDPQPRQPDPPRPFRTNGDGHGGQCCCHPFTRTWFWATVAAVLLIGIGAALWWFSGHTASSTTVSHSPVAMTPSNPLAADKGEFLTLCQQKGGTFKDCLNGFEAVTH